MLLGCKVGYEVVMADGEEVGETSFIGVELIVMDGSAADGICVGSKDGCVEGSELG